jgi:hypothetical protein
MAGLQRMIPTSTIAALAKLGLSADQIDVVASLLGEVEAATKAEYSQAIEARRAADRARKQRQRHGKSRDGTGQDVTSRTSPPATIKNARARVEDISSNSEIHEEGKKDDATASSKEKPTRGTRLPNNWEPAFDAVVFSSADSERTGNQPLTPGEIERELARFRDYWRGVAGSKGAKTDWQGTFRNWLRKAADDKQNRKPAYTPRLGPADKMANAITELREQVAGVSDTRPSDFTGSGPPRLLSGTRGS